MRSVVKPALVLSLMLACTACATTRVPEGETGDPVADAQWNFKHGDYSLAAINAVTLQIPGVAGDSELILKIAARLGVHYLNGSNSQSETYGATYNQTMIDLRGCDKTDLLGRCKK